MKVFEQNESNVRSYCRSFSAIFNHAKESYVYSDSGEEYIDFFAGAGALNYGHNPDFIKEKLIEYIESDGITHGLDLHTVAKRDFINSFSTKVLQPRGLNYKLQFCGPTGTNAVEAAMKLARKVTGRMGIFSFMGGFHGMTLGSLAATGNRFHRQGANLPLSDVTFMPYPAGYMESIDTIQYIEAVLNDSNSGIDKPAAIILETIQGEGGVNVAPVDWLKQLRALCDRHEILMICDEIQVGCFRSGTYFSFERAGIVPDLVTVSKSIAGYGIPLALVLMKPELDIWESGEHNGTFRGNQMAFITAKAALEYSESINLEEQVAQKEALCRNFLEEILAMNPNIQLRGAGLILGLDFTTLGEEFTKEVADLCFEKGLLIEKAGREDIVLKLMPPLTIPEDVLITGLKIIKESIITTLKKWKTKQIGFNRNESNNFPPKPEIEAQNTVST